MIEYIYICVNKDKDSMIVYNNKKVIKFFLKIIEKNLRPYFVPFFALIFTKNNKH